LSLSRHRFAVFTALWTFFVIIAGGTVTSTGSGLSVPDWPLSFGKLMPPMVGGVFFEHGHRMVAATAGLLMVCLCIWTAREETRAGVRTLGYALVGTVIAQGLLGGLTVLLRLPPAVSSTHAAIAQLTFCLTITMALVTSPSWRKAGPVLADARLSLLAPLTTAAVYLQIIVGAVVRHTEAGLSIPDFPLCFGSLFPTPDTWTPAVLVDFAHRGIGATVVSCLVLLLVGRVLWRHRDEPGLVRLAWLLTALVVTQIILGGCIIWTGRMVPVTVAHVATGALILGTSLLITLRVYRLSHQELAS
jgi:cytochrome c oxidase assembly protein subunit 15